jgi:hypothetical protein
MQAGTHFNAQSGRVKFSENVKTVVLVLHETSPDEDSQELHCTPLTVLRIARQTDDELENLPDRYSGQNSTPAPPEYESKTVTAMHTRSVP